MGYSTSFYGTIDISPALSEDMFKYIRKFSNVRHVKRDVATIPSLNDGEGLSFCFNGNPGTDGCYYVGEDRTVDSPTSDADEPLDGLSHWCDFSVSTTGDALVWTKCSDTKNGLEWITFLIEHFLKPLGHVCNGKMECQGDEFDDQWELCVENNKVTRKEVVPTVMLYLDGNAINLIDPKNIYNVIHESTQKNLDDCVMEAFQYMKKKNYNLEVAEGHEFVLIEKLKIKQRIEIQAILAGLDPSAAADCFTFKDFYKHWKENEKIYV